MTVQSGARRGPSSGGNLRTRLQDTTIAGRPLPWYLSGWRLGAGVLVVMLLFPVLVTNVIPSEIRLISDAIAVGIYVILAVGLNIVVGYAGLLDLGYVAFFAIGSYAEATGTFGALQVNSTTGQTVTVPVLPFWPLLVVGALVAFIFGVLLGAPTLRLRGDYLAIVTLGFGEIVPVLFNYFPYWFGNTGMSASPPADINLAGLNITFSDALNRVPSTVRQMAGSVVAGPTPTATLAPAVDEFYLLPNPPDTRVLLDGRPLQRLPLPGTAPLRVAHGRHVIDWLPGALPFAPLRCVLSVPRTGDDSCPVSPGYVLPTPLRPAGSPSELPSVIDLHVSIAALPQAQAGALRAAIARALAPLAATATVQPGELYFTYRPGVAGHPEAASQPLRATATVRLDAPGALGGCTVSPGAIQPCRAPDQDCSELCTLPGPAPASTWLAAALVSTYWSYTTLDGTPVAQQIGDLGLNAHLVVLLIAYSAGGWSVTPIVGHTGVFPASDDLACDPARSWLAQGPLARALGASTQSGASRPAVAYASDSLITDGCVVSVGGLGPAGTPAGLFLLRFGVLLAANDAAHALWPAMPRADGAEAALAQRLAASLAGA